MTIITETEAAKMLGLSARSLQRHRTNGMGVPHIKIMGAVRYSKEDIEIYLAYKYAAGVGKYDRKVH